MIVLALGCSLAVCTHSQPAGASGLHRSFVALEGTRPLSDVHPPETWFHSEELIYGDGLLTCRSVAG